MTAAKLLLDEGCFQIQEVLSDLDGKLIQTPNT